jgi:hypothetical protein
LSSTCAVPQVRQEQYLAAKRAFEAQQMQINHMQDYIDRFYNEKRSSAQVRTQNHNPPPPQACPLAPLPSIPHSASTL